MDEVYSGGTGGVLTSDVGLKSTMKETIIGVPLLKQTADAEN